MDTYTGLQIPTPILLELLNFLNRNNIELDPSEVVAQAIRTWLDDTRRQRLMDEDQELEGYLWKNVFLPNGTRIHLASRIGLGCAFIVDGQFMHRGSPTSPNKYASLAGGGVRNAWKELVVRTPGATRPKYAFILRREQAGAPSIRRGKRKSLARPSDAELLPPPIKQPKLSLGEIPDWVMNNRRKNCKCMGDVMFED